MGIANDIASLDATAQAELVRDGSVSASELVDAAIDGAQRVNPQINAIIHPRYESAAAEAGAPGGGPFAGVPMVVKDLGCMMKGEPYHLGSRGLKSVDNRGSVDSSLYRRFREARFVAIGRTNAPEMGSTITTEPLAYGPSRNPWNRLPQFTAQFNVTGQPAISLPLYWTAEGLPVGVQLVAGFGREDVLVRIAAQLEAAQPWASRRPPVSA